MTNSQNLTLSSEGTILYHFPGSRTSFIKSIPSHSWHGGEPVIQGYLLARRGHTTHFQQTEL